jgi:hypothetical protein
LIWPLFGPFDREGNVEIDQFLQLIITATGSGKARVHAEEPLEIKMLSLQKTSRQERINLKTKSVVRFTQLSVDLRRQVVERLKDMDTSCDEAFRLFDTDHGGTIAKGEFFHGLEQIGVQITPTEVDAVWPMFNLDTAGTISKREWGEFLDDKMDWSFHMMGDKFTRKLNKAKSPDPPISRKISQPLLRLYKQVDTATQKKRRNKAIAKKAEAYRDQLRKPALALYKAQHFVGSLHDVRAQARAACDKRRPARRKMDPRYLPRSTAKTSTAKPVPVLAKRPRTKPATCWSVLSPPER